MNLLYVGTLPPHPGGAAVSCAQFLTGFAQRGCTVRALAPITAETLSYGAAFDSRLAGIRVTRYRIPFFVTRVDQPLARDILDRERGDVEGHLEALIRAQRPDLVIMGRESFTHYVTPFAKRHRLRTVLLVRGNPTTVILNGTYPQEAAAEVLALYRQADLTITVSNFLAEGLRRRGVPRTMAIPNAVDLQQFHPGPKNRSLMRELGIREDDIVVAHVSALRPQKRVGDLVASAARALQAEPRLRYLIVGDGAMRRTLEEECRRCGVAERFRFTGQVEYPRVPEYLNLADMVIMPSEAEGLARTYIESQACGKVLLASDIPAAREVVAHGVTGLLFAKGDIADLTAQTLLAAGDSGLRGRLGRRARQQAIRRHRIEGALTAYLSAFEKLVDEVPLAATA